MEKLYFHPNRKKLNSMPIFMNSYYHEILTYFLETAEVLEPKLINDLDALIPIYTKAEQIHEEKPRNNSYRIFMDNWNIVHQASTQNNPHLIDLKKSILQWAKKYNLVDDSVDKTTFLEIALWAIPDKRDYGQEIEDKKRFLKSIGRQVPQHFPKWSITNPIYFENESENDRSINEPDKIFPFVFSPSHQNIHQSNILGPELDADDFENILVSYDFDVHFALKGQQEKVKGYLFSRGWDPRLETWKDFETMLDVAFRKYKTLYKKRTVKYMEKQGYIEGKSKRNKEHFEWLVRYQIQEWNIKDIADYYSKGNKIISEDTIRKALSSVSILLDLKLRV